jgi:hypothetical protein
MFWHRKSDQAHIVELRLIKEQKTNADESVGVGS